MIEGKLPTKLGEEVRYHIVRDKNLYVYLIKVFVVGKKQADILLQEKC